MTSSILADFLARWTKRRSQKRIRSNRPQLEQLEDRCCPSSTYNSVVLADGPTAYYPLNDTTGPTMTNAATTGATDNGTYFTSGLTYGQTGPIVNNPADTAVAFNGSTGYATIPPSVFNYPTSGNTTTYSASFGVWFKTAPSTFDGSMNNNYAWSADQLAKGSNWTSGTAYTWNNGTVNDTFTFGAANVNNVVSGTGQTITLPVAQQGVYTTLDLLASAINGNQSNQTFIVTYTDGTTSTFTQSLSDWVNPQNPLNTGEKIAADTPYLDSNGNTASNGHVYGYSFALTAGKTVQSITLPNNGNVKIFAANLDAGTTSTPINLSASFNQVGMVTDASALTGGLILGQTGPGGTPGVAGNPNGWVDALYVGNNGHLFASMFWHNGTNVGSQIMESPNPVNDGNWHFLVDTYSAGVETLYLDGQVIGSQTVTQYSQSNPYKYYLGAGYGNGWPNTNTGAFNGWSYFDGSLAQVAVYPTALTAQQVQTQYDAGINNDSNLTITETGGAANSARVATYAITVTNNATAMANGVTVTDPFSATLYTGDTWTATATAGSSVAAASGSGNIDTTVNLAAGGSATFIVNATLAASTPNPQTNTATAAAPGMTPTNLEVTEGNVDAQLAWDGVTPAATYNIYRGTSSGSETLLASGVTGTSYTDTTTVAGTTYYYYVTASYANLANPPSNVVNYESPPSNEVSLPVASLVSGLQAQYYSDPTAPQGQGNFTTDATAAWLPANLRGSAVVPNVNDAYVGYGGGYQTTNPSLPNYLPPTLDSNNGNNFSVSWTGYLKVPTTGTYTFATGSDDGSYLFLNGTEIVDNGYMQGTTYRTSSSQSLTAGQMVPIQMYYYQGGGGAQAVLEWTPPGATAAAVIPSSDLFAAQPPPTPPTQAPVGWTPQAVTATADTFTSLSVSKTANATVTAGKDLTYAVTITNTGSNTAYYVSLNDPLPADETFVSDSGATGWTTNDPAVGANGTINDTIYSLAAGATVNFDWTVQVAPNTSNGTTLNNTVTAAAYNGIPVTSSASTTVNTQANLTVTKTAASTVAPGNNLVYTVVVSNTGPSDAQNVVLTDPLPANSTFLSDSGAAGWTATDPAAGSNGTITETLSAAATTIGDYSFESPSLGTGGNAFQYAPSGTPWTFTPDSSTGGSGIAANGSAWAFQPAPNGTQVAFLQRDGTISQSVNFASAGTYSLTFDAAQRPTYPNQTFNVLVDGNIVGTFTPSGTTFTSFTTNDFNVSAGAHTIEFQGVDPTGVDQSVGIDAVTLNSALAPGASATFTWTVAVGVNPSSGTMTNTASATASNDPVTAAGSATTTISTTPSNLLVTKTTTDTTVAPGSNITYTITIQNTGNNNAQNVVLNDPLPAGETFVSDTQNSGPGFSQSDPAVGTNGTINDTIGTLFTGQSATFTWVVNASSTIPQDTLLKNIVTASATNRTSYTSEADTTVLSPTTLTVSKTAPAIVGAGNDLAYTVTVTNTGSYAALNVALNDPLPANEAFVSDSGAAGWTVSDPAVGANGTINDTIATLAAGATATFTWTVQVGPASSSGTIYSNTVTASAQNVTPSVTSTATTTAYPAATLTVSKTASSTAIAGSNLVYTVTVDNTSANTAHNVALNDPLPAGETFVSDSGATGWTTNDPAVGANGTINDTIATLAAGATATFTWTVQISPSEANNSTLANTVTASAANVSPSVTSTATTTVNTQTLLTVTKTATTGNVYAGSNLTYNLGIDNALGYSNAQNVTLTDVLPTGETFVSVGTLPAGWTETDPGVGNNGTVTFTDANPLAPSATPTAFTLVVNVSANASPGSLSNTVNAATTTTTNASSTLSATATVTVGTQVDLTVTKTAPATVPAGSNLTYNLGIDNALGYSYAQNVTLTDVLPTGETFSSVGTLPTGWTDAVTTAGGIQTVTFSDANPLAPSATPTSFTLVVTVSSSLSNGTVLSNTVTASTTSTTVTGDVLTATANTTIEAQALLTVTKTATTGNVYAGSNLTYNLGIDNSGPSNAQGVTLTDVLPTGETFSSVGTLPTGWTDAVTTAGGIQTVTFSDANPLAPSITPTNFTLVVTVGSGVASGTVITNTVNATTTTISTGSTLSASANVTVATQTTLTLTKTGSPNPVANGQYLTYALTVDNGGPSDATNVTVSDPLPTYTTYVGISMPAGWSVNPPAVGSNGTVTFNDASLAPSSAVLDIVVQVNVPLFDVNAVLSNTATVTTATPTTGASVLTATATTNVNASPNSQFVYNVYEQLLNRAPDPGATGWVTALNNGMAPSTFVLDVEQSPEYLTDLVASMYGHYLNRAPDAGASGWVNALESGASIESVRASILASAEFYNDAGDTNTGFLQALYQDVLGRAADPAGLNAWLNYLNVNVRNGTGADGGILNRYQVAMAFLTSTEYRTDLVGGGGNLMGYYPEFLKRQADLPGLTGWIDALQAGVSDQVVLAAIFGSAEGYSKNS